jgi:hypothetical protein
MIVNDKVLDTDTDSTPIDAPPSYEAAAAGSSSVPTPAPADTKRLPISPLGSGSSLASSSLRAPPANTSWFNFASSTTRQVRATVLGLVRDLVKLDPSDHSVVAISILKSCADACAANGLSISTVLQEKSVEGHTPCKSTGFANQTSH